MLSAGLSARHLIGAVEASLKRLGTDWIDVFQLHTIDALTPIEETARAMENLVRAGKIRYVGFSNWPAWKAACLLGVQERHGWQPIRAAQLVYGLVQRDIEEELVDFMTDAGIGLLVYSPLAFGLLSGKYSRNTPPPPGSRMAQWEMPTPLFDRDLTYDVIDVLKEIAARREATPAQIALAWVLTRPFVTSVIFGATKLSQMQDNLKAVDIRLTPAEVSRLQEMTTPKLNYPAVLVREASIDAVLKSKLTGQGRSANKGWSIPDPA
jgi:aryl-alcohol dehydrogenase-like predicted oxidoreductase